nr:hypothetical protein [Cutibacterium acnes]
MTALIQALPTAELSAGPGASSPARPSAEGFIKIHHDLISAGVSGNAMALFVALRNQPGCDQWTRHSYLRLAQWCGWDGLSEAAGCKRVQRAAAELASGGWLESRVGHDRRTAKTLVWHRLTSPDTDRWEQLPRIVWARICQIAGETSGEWVRHWLVWRMLAGRTGVAQAPTSIVARFLGCSSRQVSHIRGALVDAGLLGCDEVSGAASRVWFPSMAEECAADREVVDGAVVGAGVGSGEGVEEGGKPLSILSTHPCRFCPPTPVDFVRQVLDKPLDSELDLGSRQRVSSPTRARAAAEPPKPKKPIPPTPEPAAPASDSPVSAHADEAAELAWRFVGWCPQLVGAPKKVRGQLRQMVAKQIRLHRAWLDVPALTVAAERVREIGALGDRHCEIVRDELHGVIADRKAAPPAPSPSPDEGDTTVWIYKDPHETLDEFAARTEPSRVWEVSERDDMAGGIAVNLLAAKPDDPMGWLTRRQTMLMVRFPQAVDEVVEMCHIVRTALEADMAAGTRWEDR